MAVLLSYSIQVLHLSVSERPLAHELTPNAMPPPPKQCRQYGSRGCTVVVLHPGAALLVGSPRSNTLNP